MIKCRNCDSRCEAGMITGRACHPAPTRVRVKGNKRDFGVFKMGDLPQVKESFKKIYPSMKLETKDLP